MSESEWSDCVDCPLALWRKRNVQPRGSFRRGIMFVGEAPGMEEESRGKAFVGKSGELLDHWLAYLGLLESDVYITNLVKCRPPQNRDPTPFEVECCQHWLEEEIRRMEPRLVIPLGRFARDAVLAMKDRGVPINYGYGLKHPAYYLRQNGMGHIPSDELNFIKRKLSPHSYQSVVEDG